MTAVVKTCRTAVVLVLLALTACTASKSTILARAPVDELNVDGTRALKGYDAVAYFTEARPVPGDPQFSLMWHGATWQFRSAENLAAFTAHPERYAPQYGGYCAYAIAKGRLADISPKRWAIVDNKLYLNNNVFSQTLWDLDRGGQIRSGDENWQITPRRRLPFRKE